MLPDNVVSGCFEHGSDGNINYKVYLNVKIYFIYIQCITIIFNYLNVIHNYRYSIILFQSWFPDPGLTHSQDPVKSYLKLFKDNTYILFYIVM